MAPGYDQKLRSFRIIPSFVKVIKIYVSENLYTPVLSSNPNILRFMGILEQSQTIWIASDSLSQWRQ